MSNSLYNAETLQALIIIIHEETGKTPRPEDNLVNDLDMDSLELASLIVKLEKDFDIPVINYTPRNMQTVGDVAVEIDRLLAVEAKKQEAG